MPAYLKDLIDLPTQVHRGHFVLRLTEGVSRPEETLRHYVVAPQLVACFDDAFGFIRSALESRRTGFALAHPRDSACRGPMVTARVLLAIPHGESVREGADAGPRRSQ